MICLRHRRTCHLVLALLILGGGSVSGQTQTPGQITKFAQGTEGDCRQGRERERCLREVDSVITQDPSGNIGIGTTSPATALDVATGDVNVAGDILLGGNLFLHNFGSFNTFVGQRAGNLSMTGASNTASGYSTLFSNINGGDNTASGFLALTSNTSGGGNTASGSLALLLNTTGSANTASGNAALGNNTTGFGNTAFGDSALGFNTMGNFNTAVGWGADVQVENFQNATAIGAFARVDASNKIRLGNTQVAVIEGQVPYTFVSDRNQKENFHAVDGEAVLKKVSGLNLTSWNYIGHNPLQFRHYGPVAQEFFAAFGRDSVGTIGTSTTINSGDLEGILMVAVQALEKRTAENADLRARIEALEKLVKGATTEGR